jgi:hypothetical protein
MWRFLVSLYKAARTKSRLIFDNVHLGRLEHRRWVICPKFALSWPQLAYKRTIIFFCFFAAAVAEQLALCG